MFFFQIPWLPEALMRLTNYAPIRRELTRTVNPRALPPSDLVRYIENVRQPGALTGGINYYRALARLGTGLARPAGKVKAPTLVVWGEQDPYLAKEGAELSRGFAEEIAPGRDRHDSV